MKSNQILMSKKFHSMLLGGTLTWMVVSFLLLLDSIVAGIVIGSDAVAGITLVTPVYSLSAFFGSMFSIGVSVLYAREMGKFNKEKGKFENHNLTTMCFNRNSFFIKYK